MSEQNQKNSAIEALLSASAKNLQLAEKKPIDATAWFLGPKAENASTLLDLVKKAAQSHIDTRLQYMPDDPRIFDQNDPPQGHQESIKILTQELESVLTQLKGSIPLASYRNQSHMYWDITLPGAVGYFAGMLYNQNNVAAEASPVTTMLEIQVGKDLCDMLGFRRLTDPEDPFQPWGHITCDGSIANGEAMWAAHNLKFLPIAVAAAIKNDLKKAEQATVETCQGKCARLIDLNTWNLLNLPIDEIIGLIHSVADQSGIAEDEVVEKVDQYTVQKIGIVEFQQQFLSEYKQAVPLALVPGNAHYSWPKTATLIGLGSHSVVPVSVDLNGRMDMQKLRDELDQCLSSAQPVMQVVAVMGSTAEGAVDPLLEILKIREDFQKKGLNFAVHVDGAWGGYFASLLRFRVGEKPDPAAIINDYPESYVSEHFKTHFKALKKVDSVTLDPHKSGFIPYPAGCLCYRNGAMRYQIAYTSPVVSHGAKIDVGTYGIEGSKPGAAATSVYLSHKVIPLDTTGYGRLLGRCLFNSKRFYAALMAMDLPRAGETSRYNITALQRLPAEKQGLSEDEILKQKHYLKSNFVSCTSKTLIEQVLGLPETATEAQKKALALFQEIGSDLSIIAYAFNFNTANGQNTDLKLMNDLTDLIFSKLSLKAEDSGNIPSVEMFVTASEFDPLSHGQALLNDFARRAGVTPIEGKPIKFLISTTQNPWLSTTDNDFNMIDPLIEILSRTVNQSIDELLQQ